MQKILNHISKLTPSEKDGVLEIIAVNRELTFIANSPMYSPSARKIKHFYNDYYVVSIDGKIKATLRSKENHFADCVIYNGSALISSQTIKKTI